MQAHSHQQTIKRILILAATLVAILGLLAGISLPCRAAGHDRVHAETQNTMASANCIGNITGAGDLATVAG